MIVHFGRDCRRYNHLRTVIVNVFGVVCVKLTVKHDFTAGTGLWIVITQHCTFDLATGNTGFDHDFMVKFERQVDSSMVLRFVGDFTDANGRALIGRFYKQR